MGFFSKILGIDKGIDVTARNCVTHMKSIQPYIKDKNELIKYLSANNIEYGVYEDTNDMLWNIKLSVAQTIKFVRYDNDVSFVSGNFQILEGNPLEAVSFSIFSNVIKYKIDYKYKKYNTPLPSQCQTFINSLNSYGINGGF